MEYSYLNAEQVGFIEEPQNEETLFRLEMSGGEFCGNGVLAAAALAKYLDLTSNNKFKLESSGANHPLECYVELSDQYSYQVRSAMPVDYNYRKWKHEFQGLQLAGRMVQFEGITHLLVADRDALTEDLIEQLLKELASEIAAEALGLIVYNQDQAGYSIKPCVYVKQTGSLVFERGCGSGTLAVGIHLARKRRESVRIDVKQPGGSTKVEIVVDDKESVIKKAFLETEVDVTCQGTILI